MHLTVLLKNENFPLEGEFINSLNAYGEILMTAFLRQSGAEN